MDSSAGTVVAFTNIINKLTKHCTLALKSKKYNINRLETHHAIPAHNQDLKIINTKINTPGDSFSYQEVWPLRLTPAFSEPICLC